MSGREKGSSLTETIVALGLLCIISVPALNTLRQSARNYRNAYSAYRADLILNTLLAEFMVEIEGHPAGDISGGLILSNALMGFGIETNPGAGPTPTAIGGQFEAFVVVSGGAGQTFAYPTDCGLTADAAIIDPPGCFQGSITAAVKDTETGVVRVRAIPF